MAEEARQYENDYIRRDFYNADVRRLEILMHKNQLELRLDNEKLKKELSDRISNLEGSMKALDEKLEGSMKALDGKIDTINERLEGKITKLDTKLEGSIKALDRKIDTINERLEGKITKLDTKLEGAIDSLMIAIDKVDTRVDGLEKRLDDMHKSYSRSLALLGIIVTIAISLIQHFWK